MIKNLNIKDFTSKEIYLINDIRRDYFKNTTIKLFLKEYNNFSFDYINSTKDLNTLLDNINLSKNYTKDLEVILIDTDFIVFESMDYRYNFITNLIEKLPKDIKVVSITNDPSIILGAGINSQTFKTYTYEDSDIIYLSNEIKDKDYTYNSLITSPLFNTKWFTTRGNTKASSDDYIWSKIHNVISKRLKNDINIDEEEIERLIDIELDKL